MSGISNNVRHSLTSSSAEGSGDEGNGDGAPTRRQARRDATRREIVDAAWEMVREAGLTGLSMRNLGERVGMRAQSLYSYFAAKDDIYDALFLDGNEEFLAWMSPALDPDGGHTPAELARDVTRRFFEFCVADPVRYQLLFQRTIPGFTPSPESYAVAVEALARAGGVLVHIGITDPEALDLWTAVMAGLTSQQLANDPGGDRWGRLVDRAVHMLLTEFAPELLTTNPEPATRRRPSQRRTTP